MQLVTASQACLDHAPLSGTARALQEERGEILYTMGFAESRNEKARLRGHNRSPKKIAHRIRSRNKEACRFGVGECQRKPGGDLACKRRSDAARRPQHIAQPERDESIRIAIACPEDNLFAYSLGRTHDADGIDSLVCREKNKTRHTRTLYGFHECMCAKGVGFRCCKCVRLHEWHMFKGRGVEDDLGGML